MWMAMVALLGLFVATYLALYKLGYIGTLVCDTKGSCEQVQATHFSRFLGVPVALWGVAYYALVLALAFVGIQDRFAEAKWVSLAIAVLTGWGVLFSGYLTYLELFVIHLICRWCVSSALLTTTLFVLAVIDWRHVKGGAESDR
jgi:uncharacterized membrane protein